MGPTQAPLLRKNKPRHKLSAHASTNTVSGLACPTSAGSQTCARLVERRPGRCVCGTLHTVPSFAGPCTKTHAHVNRGATAVKTRDGTDWETARSASCLACLAFSSADVAWLNSLFLSSRDTCVAPNNHATKQPSNTVVRRNSGVWREQHSTHRRTCKDRSSCLHRSSSS